MITVTCKI